MGNNHDIKTILNFIDAGGQRREEGKHNMGKTNEKKRQEKARQRERVRYSNRMTVGQTLTKTVR